MKLKFLNQTTNTLQWSRPAINLLAIFVTILQVSGCSLFTVKSKARLPGTTDCPASSTSLQCLAKKKTISSENFSVTSLDQVVRSADTMTIDLKLPEMLSGETYETFLSFASDGETFGTESKVTVSGTTVSWTAPTNTSTAKGKVKIRLKTSLGREASAISKSINVINQYTRLAGRPSLTFYSNPGKGSKFFATAIHGMTDDGTYLYLGDWRMIWRVKLTTNVAERLVGVPGSGGSVDGSRSTARLSRPFDMKILGGVLYFIDDVDCVLRSVIINESSADFGKVTTVAGTSGSCTHTDAVGASAGFKNPYSMTTDGTDLFIVDAGSYTVRRVEVSNFNVTTIAGIPNTADSATATADATTVGSLAKFALPLSLVYANGYLYVYDSTTAVIRKISTTDGFYTTSPFFGVTNFLGSNDGGSTVGKLPTGGKIATDGTKIYFSTTYNESIRAITISTATSTTLAGQIGKAGYSNGAGLFQASFGLITSMHAVGNRLFVADRHNSSIREVNTITGDVSTPLGSASNESFISKGSPVNDAATLQLSRGITSADGNKIYVSDHHNMVIRMIDVAANTVTTIAGSPGIAGYTNGFGASAKFSRPFGMVVVGNFLYVADGDNNVIRKVDLTTYQVSTFAGAADGSSGSTDNADPTVVRFYAPYGITTDGTYLYVADTSNNRIRKVTIATGETTTLAGSGANGSADLIGIAATFRSPRAITITPSGTDLYIGDTTNQLIRKIVIATGQVTTVAGLATAAGDAISTTPDDGTSARFNQPYAVLADADYVYIADTNNSKIKKMSIATTKVSLLAGGSAYSTQSSSQSKGDNASILAVNGLAFSSPSGGAEKELFASSHGVPFVFRVGVTTGQVNIAAGNIVSHHLDHRGSTDGLAKSQTKSFQSVAMANGYLYSMDPFAFCLYRMKPDGSDITIVAGKHGDSGSVDGVGTSARLGQSFGMVSDGTYLYWTENDNATVRRFTISDSTVTTIAGTAAVRGNTDATGSSASFKRPGRLSLANKKLYIADETSHLIRTVSIDTSDYGKVTTLAGTADTLGSTDGAALTATFYKPTCTYATTTEVYVCDYTNNRIRKIDLATNVVSTVIGNSNPGRFLEGTGTSAEIIQPVAMTTDGKYYYVITETGQVGRINPSDNSLKLFAGDTMYSADSDLSLSIKDSIPQFKDILFDATYGFFVTTAAGFGIIK
ncbi:MAG: hypothetical protein NT027_07555 [Proteobacteria bacterium]|nr:hypothetical protein [Pseudomonadota bacterium]